MSEILLRGFYLRLLKRWYILPLCAAAGAIAGFMIYFCSHVVFSPGREYAAGARLYLEFSPDAAGNARDYYNAWTWKELVTDEEIVGSVMKTLWEEGYSDETQLDPDSPALDGTVAKIEDDELVLVSGSKTKDMITRADFLSSITVRLPSDLRLMMLTVTFSDSKRADAMLDALTEALVDYGKSNPTFLEIRVLEKTPALLLVSKDLTLNAVVFGAVLGFIASVLILFLYFSSDDSCNDPESCERRYGIRVLGVIPAAEKLSAKEMELRDRLREELISACSGALSGLQRAAVISASPGREEEISELKGRLESELGERFLNGACSFSPAGKVSDVDDGMSVIVCIPAGKRISAFADHMLSGLKQRGVEIAGLVLFGADVKYLRRLYGFRK